MLDALSREYPDRDHPREYGENVMTTLDLTGKDGIIPANTGRIEALADHVRKLGDHPREYGENGCMRIRKVRWSGSSPRIRGE